MNRYWYLKIAVIYFENANYIVPDLFSRQNLYSTIFTGFKKLFLNEITLLQRIIFILKTTFRGKYINARCKAFSIKMI